MGRVCSCRLYGLLTYVRHKLTCVKVLAGPGIVAGQGVFPFQKTALNGLLAVG